MIRRMIGAAIVALAALAMPALSRQADDDAKPLGDVAADLKLVPPDATFFLSVRVADVLGSAQGKGALKIKGAKEMLAALEAAGVDPAGVERATVFMRHPDQMPAVIVRTAKAFDGAALRKALGADDEHRLHGKTFHAPARPVFSFGVWAEDEKTFVIGELRGLVPYLAVMEKAAKKHALADELKAASGKHSATLAVLPSLTFRQQMAANKARMERWREEMKKKRDFPKEAPLDPLKDAKKAAARAKFMPVRFQKDKGGFLRAPDLSTMKDEPLKLLDLEETFEAMDEYGPQSAFLRSAFRCRRLLATIDIGDDVAVKARGLFADEAEGKDGAVTAKAILLLMREMLPAMFAFSPIDVRASPYKELLESVQGGLRAGEVKRDGKAVEASVKFKLDFSGFGK